jgi:hypothetical protein
VSDFCGEIEESCLLVCHFYLCKERADTLTTKIRFPETSEVSPPQIGKRQRMKQQNLERILSKTNLLPASETSPR